MSSMARSLQWQLPRREARFETPLQTPLCVLHSSLGQPASFMLHPQNLQRGVLKDEFNAVRLGLADLLGGVHEVVEKVGGVHEFCNSTDRMVLVDQHDPFGNESVTGGRAGCRVKTRQGVQLCNIEEFTQVIQSARPDVVVCLSDEIPVKAPRGRAQKSTVRSASWLSVFLDSLAEEKISSDQWKPQVFASIHGGAEVSERERCAKAMTESSDVRGFSIHGIENFGETMEQRSASMKSLFEILPNEGLRLVSRVNCPLQVLELINGGIDIFTSAFPSVLSLEGRAATFVVDVFNNASDMKERPSSLNLGKKEYAIDGASILEGCPCHTCTHYSRGYINHLLNTGEMTGQVLLELHNHHHWLSFFVHIRRAIEEGRFDDYFQTFINLYR